MDIKIYQKMNKIVLTMIEKENNKCSRFFVKDIKNEKFKSITSRIKEIVDIKGKRFIL